MDTEGIEQRLDTQQRSGYKTYLDIIKQYIIDYASGADGCDDFLVISSVISDARKNLHELFEKFTPWISKHSFKLKSLPSGWHIGARLRCWECDNAKTWPATYREGMMPNNEDESYYANCGDCDTIISFDINYDDDNYSDDRKMLVRMYGNNCVILGSYFKSYLKNVTRTKQWKKKVISFDAGEMDKLMTEIEAILPKLNDWCGKLNIKRIPKTFTTNLDKRELQVFLDNDQM
jgi:hypothetical protein